MTSRPARRHRAGMAVHGRACDVTDERAVGSWLQLVRLWLVALAANLVGGLVMAAMTVVALPDLRTTAAEGDGHYASLGVSWRSLFLAVLGGMVITLLTRMQHASDDLGPKLVAGIAMSFVLVAAQLFS